MSQETIHLLVFDGFADWEASYAIAALNNPEYQKQPGRFQVQTVAAESASVVSMGGVRVQPDIQLQDLTPARSALLILPGGRAWEVGGNAGAVALAQTFLEGRVPVAAICAATYALASAGLLDNRLHTSNSQEYLLSTGYQGEKHYVDRPAVTDRHLITASGVAALEFAYEIFTLLDVFMPAVQEQWYNLFKCNHAEVP